ncbi:Adaptive-response sensory-kinase SasA [bioreactor metagenome]|uniref:Adaptive-response sensory-kinase SasA n=1 Tax=bioreactor metagenome TaxID=1076179 RepID=A0A645C7Z5_9ZZZZ
MESNKIIIIPTYNEKENILECNYPITSSGENETILIPIVETNSFAVKSFELKEPIIINNLDLEYQKYFLNRSNKFIPEDIKSLYYCPIIDNDNVIGIFTIRSSQQGIFRDFNFDILNTLRTYLDISIKNILSYENLQKSINELQVTQNKLVRNEKMASLGQLTAGIAHEIKNPLNFVINFSDLSMDLIEDIVDEINNLKETKNIETINEIEELIEDMKLNVTKINEHSKRADNIIKNMLQHSRGDAGEYSLVDINALVSEFTKLSYHGMRASDTEFNVNIIYDLDKSLEKVKVVPHNISRVIINVVSNAFFATSKKAKLLNETSDTTKFSPEVIIKTINNNNNFVIIVRDNGVGISTDNVPKIFTPFFTTKSTGQGTGLGLSISYEIVIEEHHGEITFETKENEFTEFKITIPKNLE